MPDSIQLLPDNIANQIAAGEVIQRPASAVKELLENAVDAGATEINLIINDAGKSLIQVNDNGSGMSEIDARMCFERHATSKIQSIEDLFHIRTMGFRGEALASIAAVAQVELKTRTADSDTGIYLEVENSVVKKQEPIACPKGTSISMKNLFFNVPARRNFLKSNASEMRHIIDEFTRVALSFPSVFFSFTANNQQIFHLEAGSLKQRVIQLLGSNYSSKLVNVKENTDYMDIHGFAGKPDTARKTRGDQFFFVNNRFIKSPYLHHAVMNAYQDMITPDSHPMYVLFIDLDPTQVDVNVHPTKQEIKFEDEKIIYAFVQAAIKHALAQFSITPTLDFELDPSIQQLPSIQQPFTQEKKSSVTSGTIYKTFTQQHQAHLIERSELGGWKSIYESEVKTALPIVEVSPSVALHAIPFQIHNQFILISSSVGFLLIDQQGAHERILYEELSNAMKGKPVVTQRTLFPITFDLPPSDASLLSEILDDLMQLGYLIEPFGSNSFVIQGTPADVIQGSEKQVIENLLDQFKYFNPQLQCTKREKLLRTVSYQRSIKAGRILDQKEMERIVTELFNCAQPNITPGGNPTYLEFKKDQIEKMFGK